MKGKYPRTEEAKEKMRQAAFRRIANKFKDKRCEICDCLFSGFWKVSKNPHRCETCEFIEEEIKNECACGRTFENNLRWYKENGNFCPQCMAEVNEAMKTSPRRYKVASFALKIE